MRRFLLLCLFLLFVPIEYRGDGQQNWRPYILAEGLTLRIPGDITVQREKQVDFDLFIFKKDSKIILSAYLGNWPDFPRQQGAGPIKKETINGLDAESVMRQQQGALWREVLFHLKKTDDWPQRLHCWYGGLSTEESLEANKMLSSVRLAKHAGSNEKAQ